MNTKKTKEKQHHKHGLICTALLGSFCTSGSVTAANSTPINQTKVNLTTAVAIACSQDGNLNTVDFQNRCNALVGAAGGPANFPLSLSDESSDRTDSTLLNSINQVAPEQEIVPGVQATRTMKSVLGVANAAVASRLDVLRAQSIQPQTIRYAERSQQDYGQFSFNLNPTQTGGSAGIADSHQLSVWGKGNYITGDVDTSNNQLGFDFDNWGGTIGVDYRINDNIVTGAAFAYLNTDADVDNSDSQVQSDSYTGTVYGIYTHDSGLYIDGVASYGAVDFEIKRHIRYTVNGDPVNTVTEGDPDGDQFSFGAGIGYQYSIGATTIEPFARADYQQLEIDSFSETESGQGTGWAAHFSRQRVRSLPTTVGLRLNHAFSTSWGILQPQIQGAWHHEFKDDRRTIQTSFLGNQRNRTFNIVTENPDRDYFTVGASLSTTLPHGISTFLSYSTIQGYQNIDSHQITLGGRLEF